MSMPVPFTGCYLIYTPHFSVECGHSFCAPCLRQWFRAKLGERIARIPYLLRRTGDVYNCRVVPNKDDHLAYLLAILARYRVHCPRKLLSYPCPICRATVTLAPIESLTLKTLIAEAELAARVEHQDADRVNEAGVATSGYFNGLFFNLTLALNPPHLPLSRLFH